MVFNATFNNIPVIS